MGAEEVLEDGKVCHGRIDHLREAVVGKLGHDEVPAPELVLLWAPALVHLLVYVANGAVHGKRHAVARDDGVVDDVWVGEFLVHHVERLDVLKWKRKRSPSVKDRMKERDGVRKYRINGCPRAVTNAA
jgi:hypothetical protein